MGQGHLHVPMPFPCLASGQLSELNIKKYFVYPRGQQTRKRWLEATGPSLYVFVNKVLLGHRDTHLTYHLQVLSRLNRRRQRPWFAGPHKFDKVTAPGLF